jgi:hypothetical protein
LTTQYVAREIGYIKPERSDAMHAQQINRVSGKAVIVLSLIALFTVLSGFLQPRQSDEGAAAHIFSFNCQSWRWYR